MSKLLRILFFLLWVKPLLAVIIGVNLFHPNRLPKNSQCIMVANHNSHLDTLLLMNLFPWPTLHRVHPVAAADYFLANPFLAWFSQNIINIVPIPRTAISRDNNPITKMAEVLARGDSLIIFPEGSRGDPEMMKPFQQGIAHLVMRHREVPVIPVFIHGAGKSLPKGEMLLVPFFCDVVIGEPMRFSAAEGQTKQEIVQQIHEAVLDCQRWLKASLYEASLSE